MSEGKCDDGILTIDEHAHGDDMHDRKLEEAQPHPGRDWSFYRSFDAEVWANAFCEIFPQMDEGVMTMWFASALRRGHDEATGKFCC